MEELYYSLSLIDVWFDNSYRHVRKFETTEEQDAFFAPKIASGFTQERTNFMVNDLINTSVKIDVSDGSENLQKLLGYNYCVVSRKNQPTTYYFITNSKQLSGTMIECNLELDVWQTYHVTIQFSDCMINKAHCERFEKVSGIMIQFIRNINADVFCENDISAKAELVKSTTRLVQTYASNEKDTPSIPKSADTTATNYIKGYRYYLVQSNTDYKDDQGNIFNFLPTQIGSFVFPYTILVMPIVSSPNSTSTTEHGAIWNDNLFIKSFTKNNNGYAYIYDSFTSPFLMLNWIGDTADEYPIKLSPQGNLMFTLNADSASWSVSYNGKFEKISVPHYQAIPYGRNYFNLGLNPNQFAGISPESPRHWENEPKMFTIPYCRDVIFDGISATYEYDPYRLANSSDTASLQSVCVNVDSQSKLFAWPYAENNLFSGGEKNSFNGLVSSEQGSLPFAQDKYQEFLANNRNAYLTGVGIPNSVNTIGAAFQAAQGVAQFGGGLSPLNNLNSGGISRMMSGATNTMGAVVNTWAQNNARKETFDLKMEDLSSAPDNFKRTTASPFFNIGIKNQGLYRIRYELYPNEKQRVYDHYYKFGYSIHRIGNIANYWNSRYYFNYIEADIEEITGVTINNQIKNRIRTIFRQGVTIWHVDEIDYYHENIERSMIN